MAAMTPAEIQTNFIHKVIARENKKKEALLAKANKSKTMKNQADILKAIGNTSTPVESPNSAGTFGKSYANTTSWNL